MAEIFKGRAVELERKTIGNSITLTVGDFVKLVNGGIEPADAVSDQVYGILEGLTTRHGVPINQALSSEVDGTYTASTETYVSAADNITVGYFKGLVRPVFPGDIISVLADADIGTTTGSNLPGYFISVLTTDSTKVGESTAHASNKLQFITIDNGGSANSCQDPQKEGNYILVKVSEAQIPQAVQA